MENMLVQNQLAEFQHHQLELMKLRLNLNSKTFFILILGVRYLQKHNVNQLIGQSIKLGFLGQRVRSSHLRPKYLFLMGSLGIGQARLYRVIIQLLTISSFTIFLGHNPEVQVRTLYSPQNPNYNEFIDGTSEQTLDNRKYSVEFLKDRIIEGLSLWNGSLFSRGFGFNLLDQYKRQNGCASNK